MSKKNQDFETVMKGMAEAEAIVGGNADPSGHRVHIPREIDVKAIRGRVGLAQPAFAARFGFSVGAVRDWEQGRRVPEASARVLLWLIDKEPEVVLRALSAA